MWSSNIRLVPRGGGQFSPLAHNKPDCDDSNEMGVDYGSEPTDRSPSHSPARDLSGITFANFVTLLKGAAPNDPENRRPMDFGLNFVLGDPHTERKGCGVVYDTIDTRDHSDVVATGKEIAHWPAVAACWSHRVQLIGARREYVELIVVQASAT